MQPDNRPDVGEIVAKIAAKAQVIYFPVYNELQFLDTRPGRKLDCLHIVWPHRWEHDKNPEAFFQALFKLKNEKLAFKVSILGESFAEVPSIFEESREGLAEHIYHYGFVDTKTGYYDLLRCGDVIVSTAIHEFFGVAMLEGVYLGCYPLVPNRLVYPELYPSECIYNTDAQLFKRLKKFAQNPESLRQESLPMDFQRFTFDQFRSHFKLEDV